MMEAANGNVLFHIDVLIVCSLVTMYITLNHMVTVINVVTIVTSNENQHSE